MVAAPVGEMALRTGFETSLGALDAAGRSEAGVLGRRRTADEYCHLPRRGPRAVHRRPARESHFETGSKNRFPCESCAFAARAMGCRRGNPLLRSGSRDGPVCAMARRPQLDLGSSVWCGPKPLVGSVVACPPPLDPSAPGRASRTPTYSPLDPCEEGPPQWHPSPPPALRASADRTRVSSESSTSPTSSTSRSPRSSASCVKGSGRPSTTSARSRTTPARWPSSSGSTRSTIPRSPSASAARRTSPTPRRCP